MSIVFLLIGALLVRGGAGLLASSGRVRRRIERTPLSPIAQAPAEGVVKIKGKIVAGDVVFHAPLSGRPCVWVGMSASGGTGTGGSTLNFGMRSHSFYLDDGSGECALVVPDLANVEVSERTTYDGDKARALLSDVGVVAIMTTLFGAETVARLGPRLDKRSVVRVSSCGEALLAPGADLYAIGPAVRRAVPESGDTRPSAGRDQLVLSASPGPEGSLLLTMASEKETLRSRRGNTIVAMVLLIGGLLLGFAGIRSC